MADNSPVVQRLSVIGHVMQQFEEEEPLQAIQRVEAEDALQFQTIQREQAPRANNTGLPDTLKSGIEALSGMAMDHVRVHRNSDKPAHVGAHAYAQGSQIHLAPGQERHLPHEAWHVVQQAQGRVKPTMQLKGVAVNDDAGLEREADVMGARAMQMVSQQRLPAQQKCRECTDHTDNRMAPAQLKSVMQFYKNCTQSTHYTDSYHNWIQKQYVNRISAGGKREYSVKDQGTWRFVDIADTAAKEVYEIKSIGGQAGAQAEAIYYRDLLNKTCSKGWSLGAREAGFRSTPHRGETIVVRFPQEGVITYEIEQEDLSDAMSLSDESSSEYSSDSSD